MGDSSYPFDGPYDEKLALAWQEFLRRAKKILEEDREVFEALA